MKEDAIEYALRSIIRLLNGDKEEAEELGNMAAEVDKKANMTWYKIGEVIPVDTKEKLYKLVV